jgi:hypothetical protein
MQSNSRNGFVELFNIYRIQTPIDIKNFRSRETKIRSVVRKTCNTENGRLSDNSLCCCHLCNQCNPFDPFGLKHGICDQ